MSPPDDATATEPYDGYADQNADQVVAHVRGGRTSAELDAIREAEQARDNPRSSVLKAIDSAGSDSDEDATYSPSELVSRSRELLDAGRVVAAGALHGVSKPLSADEGKARVAEFLKRDVAVAESEDEAA